ncbi:MAG: glycosyltransferase [Neomegalonema sp.]|nr:glycosyltransferase [Neomegalonema sp.]
MSKPAMKLLWIFSSFGLDAPARRFASIVGRLGDEYEHVIGSMSGDFEAQGLIPESVRWRRVDLPGAKRGGVSIKNMWNFRKVITAERPHLLVTSNWEAIEWLMVNRGPGAVPQVHFEDVFGRDEQLDDADAKRAWSRRRAFPGRNRAYVAPTREIEASYTSVWGAAKDQVRHIPLGVDLELFPARDAVSTHEPLTLGAAGPLIRSRRFDRLIRLTATLGERGRNVDAVILGEGPEKEALIREAETAGVADRVRFVGAAPGCANIFSEMDLYVSTGEKQRDASGLLAAMASATPIVGLESDDVMETVAEPNRLFIRPRGDESGMAAAAELIISDFDLRSRMGQANRAKAEADFDLDKIADRFDSLFREVAGVSAFLALPAPGSEAAPKRNDSADETEAEKPEVSESQRDAAAEDTPKARAVSDVEEATVVSEAAEPTAKLNGASGPSAYVTPTHKSPAIRPERAQPAALPAPSSVSAKPEAKEAKPPKQLSA